MEEIRKEIIVAKSLEHPKINRVYGYAYNENKKLLGVFLKYMPSNLKKMTEGNKFQNQ